MKSRFSLEAGQESPKASVAERQILGDPISVRRPDDRGRSQRPATFGLFVLKQMAFASAPAQDFPGRRNLETFGH